MSFASPDRPPGATRRSFIKRGLFGGALLALGGGTLLALRGSRLAPLPAEGLQVFDRLEYSVLDAFARRVIVPAAGGPSHERVRVAFNADRVMARADPDVVAEVKQLLRLFENALAGFLFGGTLQPFTAMDAEGQDEVLRDWQRSALTLRRTGFQALRTLVLAAYYGAPESWPGTHYPGPPQGFHEPNAEVWRGGDQPRVGFGIGATRDG